MATCHERGRRAPHRRHPRWPDYVSVGKPHSRLEHFGITVEKSVAATKLADISESTLPVVGIVRCISEHAQSDPELITFLVNAGVIPGARVTIRLCEKSYAVRGLDEIKLPMKLAHIIDVDCGT